MIKAYRELRPATDLLCRTFSKQPCHCHLYTNVPRAWAPSYTKKHAQVNIPWIIWRHARQNTLYMALCKTAVSPLLTLEILEALNHGCIHSSKVPLYVTHGDMNKRPIFCRKKSPMIFSILSYRKISNIRHIWDFNKIIDHSYVVGASPVGAAPTTSSLST